MRLVARDEVREKVREILRVIFKEFIRVLKWGVIF